MNGERHRVDGPAIEYTDGEKHWFLNGERHRIDGPAVEHINGSCHWYVNGMKLFPEKDIHNPVLKADYPGLICAMVTYLVHEA